MRSTYVVLDNYPKGDIDPCSRRPFIFRYRVKPVMLGIAFHYQDASM